MAEYHTCSIILLIMISNLMVLALVAAAATSAVGSSGSRQGAAPTAVAEEVDRWKKTFPGMDIPTTLASRLSALTASQVDRYARRIKDGALLASNSRSFCKAAGLVCGDNPLLSPVAVVGGHQSYVRTEVDPQLFEKMSHDPTLSDFFREQILVKGTTIRLPRLDVGAELPSRKLLPRQLTQSFLLTQDTLPTLLKTLDVPHGSTLDRHVRTTMSRCLAPPMEGETKRCVSSLEELTDLLEATMGSDQFTIIPPQDEAGSLQTGKLVDVSLSAANTAMTCHDNMYPFQVYYCHAIHGTKVYKLKIELANGQVIDKVATCHMDTSQWPPMHPAFAVLHTHPGESEACHYIVKHDLLFIPGKQET